MSVRRMLRVKFSRILGFALLALFAVEARAATLILSGINTGVTHIRSDDPKDNFGNDIYMIIGRTTAPAIIRGLLSFDLSQIPTGATITSITLTLHSALISPVTPVPNASGSVALNLHDLTGTFVEGFGGNAGSPSTAWATWETSGAGKTWDTMGGDFMPTVLSSASVDPTLNVPGTVSEFASSTEFVSAAQAALDSRMPLTLLLKLNDVNEAENTRRAFHFHSDNTSTQSSAPTLTVTYVPEPASAGLILGGVAILAGSRRRPVAAARCVKRH